MVSRLPILLSSQAHIDLTHSILWRQEHIRKELLAWLDDFVIGQEEAKQALINTILAWLFNVYRDQWALGAVFLAWPTWVWKTELVRSLARTLLGDPNWFVKIPAETMAHPADISLLTGSSPWYVGYGDTPTMADTRVHSAYKKAKESRKLHPLLQSYEATNFSIVLVDEVEKAHRDIPFAFLNAIQSGQMEMSSWKETGWKVPTTNAKSIEHSKITDLSNTLFVFTSNVGEHMIATSQRRNIWFTGGSEKLDSSGNREIFEQELRKVFAPEFLGRMDQVVRCHALSKEQLEKAFALHTDRMNALLREKQYGVSVRVGTTREYLEHILHSAKSHEYGARAISGIIKEMGAQVGFALRSGRLPEDAVGKILFDAKEGKTTISFVNEMHIRNSWLPTLTNNDNALAAAQRNLVEGKINRYGDKVRDAVHKYMEIVANYDSWFKDTYRIYERRLQWYGFTRKDIDELKTMAYITLYQSTEPLAPYEIIVRDANMFEPTWFRVLEKFMRTAIVRSFSLESIYSHIVTHLGRLLTRDEGIVISQHLHRLIQLKWNKN